jgi:metallo-beta-lactamase class B
MKRFAAGLAFVTMLTSAQAAEPFAQDRIDWNKPAAPFHIIANIYYVGTADLAIYLIVTPSGDILVDTGVPESPPLIEKNIAALGFKLADIKYIINSHAHFDHAGGLAELQKKTGAKIVVGARDKAILERGYITFGPSAPIHFAPVHVDRAVKNGDMLILGGATLEAHSTPGHTPGCTSWTMSVKENGVRHRVVFACSTTTGGNPLVGNTEYPEIAADFRHSFAVFKNLKADVFLPGHARFFDAHGKAARAKAGGPNPFVDAGELHRYNEASEREYSADLAKQQAAAKLNH